MAKNDESDELAAELRDLVKGGAEYERVRAAGKPVTLSKIVAQYSEERRTPSYSGLPKWKVTSPGIAAGKKQEPSPSTSASTGTDPGLGPSEPASELMTTHTGHESTVQLPLEQVANTEVDGLPIADVSPREEEPETEEPAPVTPITEDRGSEGALKRGPVITIPTGDKAEWAAAIASQVRGGAPAKPYRPAKDVEAAPSETSDPARKPKEAPGKKASRSAETVPVRREDEVPEAPPVESRREEKRTELRIGLTAAFAATLIVGMLIGRWVWLKDDGPKVQPSASQAAEGPAPVMSSAWMKPVQPPASAAPPTAPVIPSVAPVAPSASSAVKAHGPKHGIEPGHTAEPPAAPPVPAVTTQAPVPVPTPVVPSATVAPSSTAVPGMKTY